MDIYIEYVIVDNMVINSLLLWGSIATQRGKIVGWKILLAAAIGTLLAALLPLLPLQGIFGFALKFLTGMLMVLVAADSKKLREYAVTFFLFLIYTFLLGGLITALLYGGADFGSALTQNYMSSVPVGVIGLGVIFFVWLVRSVCKFIFRQKDFGGFTRRAELCLLGKKYTAQAFMDTGNMLYDNQTGLPVVVVNKSLIADRLAEMIATGKSLDAHYIEFSTASGMSKMLILQAENLTIYHNKDSGGNIIDKFRVGVSNEQMKFDILLHPAVIEK